MGLSEVSTRLAVPVAQTTSATWVAEILAPHLDRLALPERGKAYVMEVASSPPSRSVGKHRVRNLIANVPIPHLGVVLQAESGSGEFFFLTEIARSHDVIAIYDQPNAIAVPITNKAGIKTRTSCTPDYLVVYQDVVVAYEVKDDKKLQSFCRERKEDWTQEDGTYKYWPAIHEFERLGIEYRVIPNSAVSAVRADNLRLLISVRLVEDSQRLVLLRKRTEAMVQRAGLMQIGQILDDLHIEDTTPVFQLIDQGILHVDLDRCLLASPRKVWTSFEPDLLCAIDDQGFRFKDAISSRSHVSTDEIPDPRHLKEVAARFAACGLIEHRESLKKKSDRTKRRYKKALRESHGDVTALFPRWSKCGNRSLRFTADEYQLQIDVVRSTMGDPNLSTSANGYREYKRRWKNAPHGPDHRPACRSTLDRRFRSYSGIDDPAFSRGGRRASNAVAASIDPLQRSLLPTRSFSIAHIDHHEVDLALVVGQAKGGALTKRAWLTGMVDAYSGEVLGLWLSYKDPCRESCAMVIRDCVWRHERLPEILVVDGGPEFDSVHFTTMLACLSVTRIERPPEDPRFGKEIERLFGAFKECFARGMPGFIPDIGNARKTSGRLSPAKRAALKFHELVELLEIYAFQGYNHELKPDCTETRLQLRANSDLALPFSGRKVSPDTAFLVLTSVDAPAKFYHLIAGRGIRVYGSAYSCPALLAYNGFKKHVQARLEPFDSSIIYVCLEGSWHVCRSTAAPIHGALPQPLILERTAEKQQLRNLLNSLAQEAQQKSYELKAAKVNSVLEGGAKLHADTGTTIVRRPKRSRVRMSDIEELSMEDEMV